MSDSAKTAGEKQTLRRMVAIYCRGKHKSSQKQLCPECEELLCYALQRVDRCPFAATKTFCSACKVHCYAPERRRQIRRVMRYAGPRMLFYDPALALQHLADTLRQRRKSGK